MMSDFNPQSPTILYGQGDRLKVLRLILSALDQPDQTYSIFHIAGTNGKGSTSTMLQALLVGHHLRVGLFTSPHLNSECESIQVNGQQISEGDYIACQQEIAQSVLALGLDPDQDLSQFEWTFLIAMVYFRQCQCSWVVLECGVGGELDATNAISHAEYAIFTKIGLDHLNLLGPDLQTIAATKAGIIRPHTRVVIAPNQPPQVRGVLKDRIQVRQAILVDSHGLQVDHRQVRLADGTSFKVDLGLKGTYQDENLTTVLTAYQDWLAGRGEALEIQRINQALKSVSLPGRYELVQDQPVVLLDGAHNLDAIQELCLSLGEDFSGQRLAIVCGFLQDKDVRHIVEKIGQLPADFYLTQPDFPGRAMPVQQLQALFEKVGIPALAFEDPNQAVDQALASGLDPVVVMGSFHLIKRVRRRWDHG